MTKFISAVIAWIKLHVWQSIVIGVAAVGVVATSITLPIVLSNNGAEQQKDDDGPSAPPAPITNKYTINITNETTQYGTVEMKAGGSTIVSGSQVDQGTSVTLLFTLVDDIYHLDSLEINGDQKYEATADEPYVFTADDTVATNYIINIKVTFGSSPIPE